MIPAIALLLAVQQLPGSVRPAGVNAEFHAACDAVEAAMAAKDFAKAERLVRLLPKQTATFAWDDSKVPAAWRADFARARDRAIRDWGSADNHLILKEGPKPDIRITFEPVLANDAETGMPAGLAVFYSDDPAKPRMEAVIGLKRGPSKLDASPVEVENELRYVIGTYLGLAPSPLFGPAMGRVDRKVNGRSMVTLREGGIAISIENYIASLRNRIAKKQPAVNGLPRAFTDIDKLELGRIQQGVTARASIQLTNNGTGPLAFTLIPDCGCVRASQPGTIKPGDTQLLSADFDSTEFVGDLTKHIIVYTNDPDRSSFVIPVIVSVEPAYRFVRPEGDVLSIESRTGHLDVFLYLPKGSTLQPTDATLEGLSGTVRFEPWKGELADPLMNQGLQPREGFKMSIDINDTVPVGRAGVTLRVHTSSEQFPNLMYNFYVQKGIVALPVNLYLGEIGGAPKSSSFIVSRPGKPFKITGVETDSPNLSASFVEGKKGDEYTVTVKYDGKAPVGMMKTSLKVKTDDPAQPTVTVPVSATVR